MVKPPKIRHSKSRKDPVTIELGPDEVSRIPDELRGDADPATVVDEQAAPSSSAAPSETQEPVQAGIDEPVAEEPFPETPAPQSEEPVGAAEPPPDDMSAYFGRDEKPAQTPPAVEATRRSGASMLFAGLVGGVIALAGAGALQWSGAFGPAELVNGEQSDDIESLRAELAALRQQAGEATADPRVGELGAQIEALRSEIADLGNASGAAQAPQDALDARLTELEGRLASLAQNSGGASEEALAALDERVTALGGLEQQVAALDAATRTAGENVAALGGRIDGLETQLAELSRQLEEQAAQPQMATAVAAAALKSAVDRGGPFSTELETYAAVAPGTPELAELRGFAEAGVPTRNQLAAQAPEAAGAMAAAMRPVDPNAGIFDRLVSSAGSLVDVRPVGPVEGDEPDAMVARLEQAVLDGDLAAAIAEYEKLPQAAQDAGADFMAKVRARSQADALVGKALAGALKATGEEG